MERVVSATEARIRFGELMRRVVESREPVIVRRGGEPHVVVISVSEYERLKAARQEGNWRDALDRAHQARERTRVELNGRLLPPPEEVIRQMREERSEQFAGLR